MNQRKLVSIVVPVYNEEGNICPLYNAVLDAISELPFDIEVIFVDDGSNDCSAEVISRLCGDDSRVKLVSFSRNFGHQIAVTAGIEHARGDVVITMDADLQHPPSFLPRMLAHWEEGFEVVYTHRTATEDAGWLKRWSSAAFYRLINRIVDTRIIPNAADFRLMDRKVVDCLNSMRERNRFIRGLVSWVGFRQIELSYEAARRHSGTTKYSFRRMLSFAKDGITSFSTFPLRASAYVGFVAALAGLPYAFWAIYVRLFTERAVSGWASLIVAVLFLGGVQLISLGVLGEYIGRIYDEVKGRPLYIVRRRVGFRTRRRDRSARRLSQPSGAHSSSHPGPELRESRGAS